MFSVYILFSEEHDKYYVGQTDDLERRLLQHNELSENSFTSRYRPWELGHTIDVPDRTIAIKMERFIKKQKSKKYLREVVASTARQEMLVLRFKEKT